MTSKYETLGGQVTRGECYARILHHLDELANQFTVMSHLHNTETSTADRLLARGWLGMHELIQRMRHQVTQLAKGALQ